MIGVTLGMLAGFYRGKIDTLISRTIDIVLSLPVLLLSLGLVSACGLSPNGCLGGIIKPGLLLVSYVIALFTWPYLARIVRGQVLSLREKEFIESARSLGSTNRRIMFREVLPNVAAPIIVYTTLIIPNNILFEAALSFLGIGVPQETPSWGRQLSDAGPIFTGGLVDDAVPRAVPVLHHARLQPGRGRAARCPRSQDGRLTVSSREAAFLKGGGRTGVPEER